MRYERKGMQLVCVLRKGQLLFTSAANPYDLLFSSSPSPHNNIKRDRLRMDRVHVTCSPRNRATQTAFVTSIALRTPDKRAPYSVLAAPPMTDYRMRRIDAARIDVFAVFAAFAVFALQRNITVLLRRAGYSA